MSDFFHGKRFLITGASKGIGFALARELDKEGAFLILHASSEKGYNRLIQSFDREKHLLWKADFHYPEQLEFGLIKLLDQFGSLDGFINCVGVRSRRPLRMLSISNIQEVITANFTSYLEIVRIISQKKRYNPGLSILSISSISAHVGSSGVCVYSASKAAVESATRSLAKELFKKGIRINTIVCGQVNTESYQELLDGKDDKKDPILERQYLGLLQVNDVVNACTFLLNPSSKLISGASFPLDGGYLL